MFILTIFIDHFSGPGTAIGWTGGVCPNNSFELNDFWYRHFDCWFI